MEMWNIFLYHHSIFARPFADFSKTNTATMIDMYSDASKNPNLGMGLPANLLGVTSSGIQSLCLSITHQLSS